MFVATEPGRWRDAATLAPVSPAALQRALAGARLVVATVMPVSILWLSSNWNRTR
jgi:hypothetical protein